MDLLSDLNDAQRQAVLHRDGPLLVLAGAGSGKTRVITRRVAYLISQGAGPREVLAITFTNKAAGEMRRRVEQLGAARGATLCTFHSLCARLLREFAVEASLETNFSIYDRNDQVRLVKGAMAAAEIASERFSPSAVHATISRAKNELKTADAYANQAGDFYARNIARVFREYEKLLVANNALDFDDLLLRMAFLLRNRPEIRELLGRRYRYVLIDEYQDINHAQYLLAHGIAMDHQNICATGDPDQSIYAWRGADISNILEFEQDYPDAKVVRLEENYRSTAPILAAASHLITHNKQRKHKNLWTRREGGAAIEVVACRDEHDEARHVASQIARHVSGGGNYSDVAAFYRVNSLSRVLEESLLKAAVPYRIARGVEFYNRKEIKDVLAYLKLVANGADDLSCTRIINTPTRGIGDVTVKRLTQFARMRGLSLLAACSRAQEASLSPAAAGKVAAFAGQIAAMGDDPHRPVRQVVEDVVQRSGIDKSLRGRDEELQQARANVAELISTAEEFDETSEGGTLADYLQQISLVSDADHFESSDESRGAVTLMTLHAAKGLEFPVVFVVGCEQGLLPFVRGGEPGGAVTDMEEERRLAFVGMTRAEDRLYLTSAHRRMIRGRTTPMASSQFLTEIGDEGVVVTETPQARMPSRDSQRRGGGDFGSNRGGFYADVDERAIIEAMEQECPYPPEYEHLTVGSSVHHSKFGRGRIVKLRLRWPETRAEIAFDRCGAKTIVLAKAPIELL